MVFMAILIPVVMQGLSLANRASVFAERKRMAAFLAHGKLNEIVSTESWSFFLQPWGFQSRVCHVPMGITAVRLGTG